MIKTRPQKKLKCYPMSKTTSKHSATTYRIQSSARHAGKSLAIFITSNPGATLEDFEKQNAIQRITSLRSAANVTTARMDRRHDKYDWITNELLLNAEHERGMIEEGLKIFEEVKKLRALKKI